VGGGRRGQAVRGGASPSLPPSTLPPSPDAAPPTPAYRPASRRHGPGPVAAPAAPVWRRTFRVSRGCTVPWLAARATAPASTSDAGLSSIFARVVAGGEEGEGVGRAAATEANRDARRRRKTGGGGARANVRGSPPPTSNVAGAGKASARASVSAVLRDRVMAGMVVGGGVVWCERVCVSLHYCRQRAGGGGVPTGRVSSAGDAGPKRTRTLSERRRLRWARRVHARVGRGDALDEGEEGERQQGTRDGGERRGRRARERGARDLSERGPVFLGGRGAAAQVDGSRQRLGGLQGGGRLLERLLGMSEAGGGGVGARSRASAAAAGPASCPMGGENVQRPRGGAPGVKQRSLRAARRARRFGGPARWRARAHTPPRPPPRARSGERSRPTGRAHGDAARPRTPHSLPHLERLTVSRAR
jgi:hypothetical protein